jgi:transcription-repair coupling factor (superfamily II helicase)
MRDLDIRGAGDLLGAEQSGFISDIGYDTYQKILDETIQELKEGEFKELYADEFKEENRVFVKDCSIETDVEILIPTFYVNAVDERLKLYKALNDVKNEDELLIYVKNLIDRFGALPEATEELINTMRLKWIAQDIGLEKLYLKNGSLRGYFVANPQSEYYQSEKFGKILIYVQQNMKTCKMKEIKGKLTISYQNVKSINQAKSTLLKLNDTIHIS